VSTVSSLSVGVNRASVPKKTLSKSEVQALIARLQADWFGLHYLDRAQRIAAIHSQDVSIRKIAAGLKFSDSNLRHLLLTLEAPAEDQLLARHNPVSIREMVRRGKAAAREHDVRRTETFERKRAEAARNGATAICNWLIEIGLTGPSCEQIIEEVRREFAQREQDGSLPPPPARHRLAIKELIQRSKPKSPIPDDAASISWYHQWLFRWTFCAFPDAFVKDEALDIALQQQWMR
jgi:hypothetical protein